MLLNAYRTRWRVSYRTLLSHVPVSAIIKREYIQLVCKNKRFGVFAFGQYLFYLIFIACFYVTFTDSHISILVCYVYIGVAWTHSSPCRPFSAQYSSPIFQLDSFELHPFVPFVSFTFTANYILYKSPLFWDKGRQP